jgi:hypothetical protein
MRKNDNNREIKLKKKIIRYKLHCRKAKSKKLEERRNHQRIKKK